MSSYSGSSCTRSSRDPSCRVRQRHIRRLNFGRSILELKVVKRPTSRNLVIDDNLTCIPCTEKRDYVRKWLETHENDGCNVISDDDLSRLSIVLGTSTTREKSPILGNSKKRPRINRHVTTRKCNGSDCRRNVEHPANRVIQSELNSEGKERNESKQDHPSKILCTPPRIEKVVANEVSPVLSTHRVRKRSRRKLQYNSVSLRHLKLYGGEIINTNINLITEIDNSCSTRKEIPVDHDNLEGNLDIRFRTTLFPIEAEKKSQKFQRFIGMFSSPMQEKPNFEDSSSSCTTKDDSRIETNTSNDSKDEECDKLSNTYGSSNNSSNNLNNIIEDTDTQETTKTYQLSGLDKSLIFPRQQSTSQSVVKDLDETYCSEAEMLQDQSMHISTKISEVLSLNKSTEKTNNVITQVISSLTTPSKKSPGKDIYAYLLDSGKKRRKPKKGSMVAKLLSLVNSQISNIRIWRHQMNKENDTISVRFISVFVYNCMKRFGNQFLEGILIKDDFDLLQNDTKVEEAEVCTLQVQPKKALRKDIMIMLVNNIVGSLKMISEVVINVYPPWNILSKDNLILEATYISISDDQEVPDVRNKDNTHKCEKKIVKEFNCPCIEEQRELPFCARKPTSEKPDVMQQIFDF